MAIFTYLNERKKKVMDRISFFENSELPNKDVMTMIGEAKLNELYKLELFLKSGEYNEE